MGAWFGFLGWGEGMVSKANEALTVTKLIYGSLRFVTSASTGFAPVRVDA